MGLFSDLVEKPAININRAIEEAPEPAAEPAQVEAEVAPEQAPMLFGLGQGAQRRSQLDEALGGGTAFGRSRFAALVEPAPAPTTQPETEMTPQGMSRLTLDEGEKLKVYKDTKGIDTIGVGFNLQEPANRATFERVVGFSVEEARAGRQITRPQSRALLEVTVKAAEQDARSLVPEYDQLPPVAQDALVNFVFNVGKTTAGTFKNTLAAIRRGDGKAAADGLRKSAYYKQVGARGERVAQALEKIGQPEATVVAPKPQDAASEPAEAVPLTPEAGALGAAAAGAGMVASRGAKPGEVQVFSDADAKVFLPPGGGASGPLKQVLQHPKLLSLYPELGEVPVRIVVDPNMRGSSYGWTEATRGGKISEFVVYAPDEESARGTLLHEVNHGVQIKDGRQSGGSPNSIESLFKWNQDNVPSSLVEKGGKIGGKLYNFLKDTYDGLSMTRDELMEIVEDKDKGPMTRVSSFPDVNTTAWEAIALQDFANGIVTSNTGIALDNLVSDAETAGQPLPPELDKLIADAKKHLDTVGKKVELPSPQEIYLNLTGEVQSRFTDVMQRATQEEIVKAVPQAASLGEDELMKIIRLVRGVF